MNPNQQDQLASVFNLGKIIPVTEAEEGSMNKNYFITTETNKYFVKSIREKRKDSVGYIATVERLMEERGINAVCMLPTINGTNIFEIDGHVYTVYPFIESDRSHVYSANDIKNMGSLLGKIHKAGSQNIPEFLQEKKLAPKEKGPIIEKLQEFRELILKKEQRTAIDEEYLDGINLKLSLIPTLKEISSCDSNTLVHGDYHERNLFIDQKTREIIGVCDWEKAEMMPRGYELARSLIYIVFNLFPDRTKALSLAKIFTNAYGEVYPISKEEFISGFEFRTYATVLSKWLEDIHYNKHDYRVDPFVKQEIQFMKESVQGDMLKRTIDSIF